MMAASTALSSGLAPIRGSARPVRIRLRAAAMPASAPARAKAPEITRLAFTPIRRAASKSSAEARMASPNSVFLRIQAVTARHTTAVTMAAMSHTSNRNGPTLKVLKAHPGLSNCLRSEPTNSFQQAWLRISRANEVSRRVNGLAPRMRRKATASTAIEVTTAVAMATGTMSHQLTPRVWSR